jgi:hypothetical protein
LCAAETSICLPIQIFQPESYRVAFMEAEVQRVAAAERVPQLEMVQTPTRLAAPAPSDLPPPFTSDVEDPLRL